jgi:hypothetical protein
MFFTYKFINDNIDTFIFIIFVLLNLSNIVYYFYSKNNKKKKVKFDEFNIITNNLILNSFKPFKSSEIIIEQPHIIYNIKHIDSDDDFYGHFCDIDQF